MSLKAVFFYFYLCGLRRSLQRHRTKAKTKITWACFIANTVTCNAKLNHACTYFVCSEMPPTASAFPGPLPIFFQDGSFRVIYKQQECYVQYTHHSICNVFVVLNRSADNVIRRSRNIYIW